MNPSAKSFVKSAGMIIVVSALAAAISLSIIGIVRVQSKGANLAGQPISISSAEAALGIGLQRVRSGQEAIAFFDYACAPCRASAGDLRQLVEDHDGEVGLRIFPVANSADDDSVRAAQLFYGSNSLNNSSTVHLYLTQKDDLNLTEVEQILGKDDDINVLKEAPGLEENQTAIRDLAERLGISGTPTYGLLQADGSGLLFRSIDDLRSYLKS
jgi:hypothetical protein